MTSATTTEQVFERLGRDAVRGVGDTLAELVDSAEVIPVRVRRWRRSEFLESMRTTQAVLTCALGGEESGVLTVMFPTSEVAVIAGARDGADAAEIEERRQRHDLEPGELELLAEIGTELAKTWAESLRDSTDNRLGIAFHSHGTLAPGEDANEVLPGTDLLSIGFSVKVAGSSGATGALVVESAVAERLNGGPVTLSEDVEDVPLAPIVGKLSSFLSNQSLLRDVRVACRRVGLELARHGRRDIPNPAAHRGEIVLLDVPPGEEHRFDWCARLKSYDDQTRVVLLLHYPSRSRVLRAFKARADAILGCPTSEAALAAKLQALIDSANDDGDGDGF